MKPGMLVAATRVALLGCIFASAVAAGEQSCSGSSELECIQSTKCILEQTERHGKYVCREAKGRCETGFRQVGEGDIQKACEAEAGCKFKPAECYCPPNLACACGGGPPAQCVERK